MRIQTAKCEICGTIVEAKFLSVHLKYVHPSPHAKIVSLNAASAPLAADGKPRSLTKSNVVKTGKGTRDTVDCTSTNKKSPFTIEANRKSSKPAIKQKTVKPLGRNGNRGRFLYKTIKPLGVVCILCGTRIPKGEMLKHKQQVHGETIDPPRTTISSGRSVWVSVVPGGLPGLGKRR